MKESMWLTQHKDSELRNIRLSREQGGEGSSGPANTQTGSETANSHLCYTHHPFPPEQGHTGLSLQDPFVYLTLIPNP